MEFIAYTAAIDAAISLVSLLILYTRRQKSSAPSQKLDYFIKYIFWTFVFLTVLSCTILYVTGQAQMIMFIVADIILWISLTYMILLASEHTSKKQIGSLLTLFFVFAIARNLFQLNGLLGAPLEITGTLNYFFSNLDAWLMYAVWVPSALIFFGIALRSSDAATKMRAIMFAIGLLLITFTWAFRFEAMRGIITSANYMIVAIGSIAGFALLLGGIQYGSKKRSD